MLHCPGACYLVAVQVVRFLIPSFENGWIFKPRRCERRGEIATQRSIRQMGIDRHSFNRVSLACDRGCPTGCARNNQTDPGNNRVVPVMRRFEALDAKVKSSVTAMGLASVPGAAQ